MRAKEVEARSRRSKTQEEERREKRQRWSMIKKGERETDGETDWEDVAKETNETDL